VERTSFTLVRDKAETQRVVEGASPNNGTTRN